MPLAIVIRSGSSPHSAGGEPVAEAAEAGDHLVGDEQDVVPAAELAQRAQIAGRRHDDAAGALDGLGEERRDGVGALRAMMRSVSSRHHSAYSTGDWSLLAPYGCGPGTWMKPGSGRSNGS